MIENYRCRNCGYVGIDMGFYCPGKEVAVCPRCTSEDIELESKGL